MKNRVVTISREFGSGGRTIGRQLARRLGIPCYDQEVIERIARESGFTSEFIEEKGEYSSHGNWFSNALSYSSPYSQTPGDAIWAIQRKIILELAEKGPCVIVGRCADFILRDYADCLTVFIHASMEKRAERVERIYGKREEATAKRLKDKDKRRAAYYRFYTDSEWGDVSNCHIALDSGVLGLEKCVDLIAELF